MNKKIEFKVAPKENIYFGVKIVISIIMYLIIGIGIYALFTANNPNWSSFLPLLFYISLILLYLFFHFGVFMGHIQGNAIKVSENQFSDIYSVVQRQSDLLGLQRVPEVYILQSGGILNAFATRFGGSNYIVLYSEVVESAYEMDKKLLEFVIGHELGHVKRKHFIKKLILFPSFIIPFLGFAYSRSCEYTCDNIGKALCPEGGHNGLLLLVSGRNLFPKVNTQQYIQQGQSIKGFWHWFSEKVSSHPHTTKRILIFQDSLSFKAIEERMDKVVIHETVDHSKFMPNYQ